VHSDETVDAVAGGKVQVIQKEKGFRFSLDALLIAHFTALHLREKERLLELGSGTGVISLLLARSRLNLEVIGLEIQGELVEMARRSVLLNHLEKRMEIKEGDVRKIKTLFSPSSFDVVVTNPPYRRIRSGRINPLAQKAMARHEIAGSVGEFLQAASFVLKPKGRIYVIYTARRTAELIASLRNARLEPKKMRIVYPYREASANFVLLEGIKEGGEELEILPPLFIYERTNTYTQEMEGIFRDLSSL